VILMMFGAVKAGYGCDYEGNYYYPGQLVWQSPDCECTQMICQENGKVHLVEKGKPCCIYQGKAYGSGEIIPTGYHQTAAAGRQEHYYDSQCYQLICYEGELVSLPYCPEGFQILTYNGVASCYHVSNEAYTWWDASNYCHSKGSNLAVITTPEENQAVEDYLFHNPLQSGCKYGWLGANSDDAAAYGAGTSTSSEYGNHYLSWVFGIAAGVPVSSIYDDFPSDYCRKNVSRNLFLEIVYTGLLGSNNYVWGCQEPEQPKLAVCEKCVVCEHKYQNKCFDCGELYEDGEIIEEDQHCYKVTCVNGKAEKSMVECPTLGTPYPGEMH